MHTSKIFRNRKDNSNGNDFDLDLSTLNLNLVDETIDTCRNILDLSVSKTIACKSNLLTP